jgi:protein subunit release factor A
MNKEKRLLFSVTMKDLEMQTFSVGGCGGGGKDTSNSGVRLVHKKSGAVGEGREHRSNTKNRQDALRHLAATKEFQLWHKLECARLMNKQIPETIAETKLRVDKMIEDDIKSGKIVVEEFYANQN